jgi:ribonuclease T2
MRSLLACLLIALATTASAKGEKSGLFDYWVLALSWSPNWCAQEGDARQSPQCARGAQNGWVLHGLWPQYHRGWPSFCPTTEPQPTRAQTRAIADLMGSAGLAWYQWKKHGTCSGLTAQAYYALARKAYASITRPPVFRKLAKPVRLPAAVVEQAFLKANPALSADMITITCKDGYIQEARICLSKALIPVPCGRDTLRECKLKDALFEPTR